MNLYLNSIFICVNIFALTIRCQPPIIGTTVKTIFIETTTELVTIITDIPEEDVEEALNLDYGRYSTQDFAYFNSQFVTQKDKDIWPCYNSHQRCLLTVIVPQPVCTVNRPRDFKEGYRTFETYCDAFLDNCLRKMRFWRILDFGKCYIDKKENEPDIMQTRKKNPQNFKNVFKILSDKK